MKRKIAYIALTALAIAGAFFLGKNANAKPDKYNYLDLQTVSETQIDNNEVMIYTTTGDYYSFELSK